MRGLGNPLLRGGPGVDGYVSRRLPRVLPCAHRLCNDVELGLAGSLLLGPGVHVVAGTGAIAMGRDPGGKTARANGWHEFFSDEGSAYWLGRQALRSSRAGGPPQGTRASSNELLRAEWGLESDYEVTATTAKPGEPAGTDRGGAEAALPRRPRPGTGTPRGSTNRRRGPSRGRPAACCGSWISRRGSRCASPTTAASTGRERGSSRRSGGCSAKWARSSRPPGAPPLCGGVLLAAQADGRDDPAEIAETLKSFEEMERK